jgi:hypothetical protein
MFWSKIGLGMVNIINNSDQTNLSEEELLELSKISSGKNLFITRFTEQNFIFRCSWAFLYLYAVVTFITSATLFDVQIDLNDIVAQSYRELFRVRLIIVLLFAISLIISFLDGRVFKGFLLSAIMVLTNYSVDMFFFYQEHLTEATGALPILYYTRPLLIVALGLLYRNYNKP